MQITTLDWIFLVGYLLFCAGIGIVVGLRVKDTDHYFLGKRRFGKWLMMGQSFGIGTHAEMPVSLAGAVYGVGASGIWYQWKNLFATPFYWIMAPVFRPWHGTHGVGFLKRTAWIRKDSRSVGDWLSALCSEPVGYSSRG
jgi:Na+/proline symporter